MRFRFYLCRILCLCLFFSTGNNTIAQTHLNYTSKQSDSGTVLHVVLSLDKGWWLYKANNQVEGPAWKPPQSSIQVDVTVVGGKAFTIKDPVLSIPADVYKDSIGWAITIKKQNGLPSSLPLNLTGYVSDGKTFLPLDQMLTIATGAITKARVRIPTIDINKFSSGSSQIGNSSALHVFFLGYLGGLLALITPCVFPMLPVTVSFFGNRAKGRRESIRMGAIYGLSIISIYLLVSLPFHFVTVRPEMLNEIATGALLNLVFFIVFLFFALSFFGVFTLQLPSWMAGASDSRSGHGTLAGIFFLALTLVIVSFSCTGPILGTLLVGSAEGGAWMLTAGCAGFGLALGLPFALFAVFPGWLSRLPKSGGWLERVKVSLAFIELALAFKFLSNADLVSQWGLIKREVFIAIWLVIGIIWVGYLLNIPWLIKYHKWKSSRVESVLAMAVFAFVVYLGTGLSGRNLTLLSGFAPPSFYSLTAHSSARIEADIINDYDKAFALAKQQNKKLLIDFTGWACVNCRKMEEQVWTDTQVTDYIREKYVLVSLYVDDKNKLPLQNQIFGYKTKDGIEKDIRTIGDLYAAMEAENFGQVSQPLYIVLNDKEELLGAPIGYTPNAKAFLNWLKKK